MKFVDGKVEEYDVVVAATGFKTTFPFFEPSFLQFDEEVTPLYKHVFHPDHPSLSFIGLVQPLGSIWPLSDLHAKLAANYIVGNYHLPSNIRQHIKKYQIHMQNDFIHSPRHTIEVVYHKHVRMLQKEIPANAPTWSES